MNVWNSAERVFEMCSSETLNLSLSCDVKYATLTGLLNHYHFCFLQLKKRDKNKHRRYYGDGMAHLKNGVFFVSLVLFAITFLPFFFFFFFQICN